MIVYSACEKAGAWEKAYELLKDLQTEQTLPNPRVELDITIYNSCLSAMAKVGHPQEVLALMEEMKASGKDWLFPNTQSYNHAIRACGNARKNDMAWWLFQDMQKNNVMADICTYNTLISAFKNQWAKAAQLYEDLIKGTDDRLPRPTMVTHGAFLQALERQGNYTRALDIIYKLWDQGETPTMASYTLAMSACNRGNRPDLAEEFYQKLQERGIEPSQGAKVRCQTFFFYDNYFFQNFYYFCVLIFYDCYIVF